MSDKTGKRNLPPWMTKRIKKKKSENDKNNGNTVKKQKETWQPVKYEGKIIYLQEYNEINDKFKELNEKINERSEEKIPVAFDMEWCYDPVTDQRGKTAVIQVCIDLDVCFVVQVIKFQTIPPAMIEFLLNEKVLLNGLNIVNDFKKLQKDFPEIKAALLIAKSIDLGVYYNEIFNDSVNWSLASLCAKTLLLQMDKSLRVSRWDTLLTDAQQMYAAIDVFVGQKIYLHIRERENMYDELFETKGDHLTALRSDERLAKCESEELIYKFGDMDSLPMATYKGKIHYLTDFYTVAETFDRLITEINDIAEYIEKDEKIPVAFDTEWSFDFKNGAGKTAVMQICFDPKEVYVVHMSRIQKIPAALTIFLKHERTVLHGVNIKNDFRKLERDFPCVKADPLIEKCVDLRTYFNDTFNSSEKWSLATLCAHTLRMKMDKSRNVRMSKWDVYNLSAKQLTYASIDVFVGQRIYQIIRNREKINSSKYCDFFGVYAADEVAAVTSEESTNLTEDINAIMNI